MNRRIAAGALLFAAFLAGCAGTPGGAGPGPEANSKITPAALGKIAKGLSGAQVRELLGNPATTKPLNAAGVAGQIWSYPLKTETEVLSIPMTTQDVPSFDPFSNRMTTRQEAVYRDQTVNTTDTLHLLLVDDRVIEWRVVRDQKSRTSL